MHKVIILLTRREGTTHDEFLHWWLNDHRALAEQHLEAGVVQRGDHGAEPFHVPTRVSGLLAGDLDPAAWFDVVRSRFADGLASVERPEARERVESC